MNPYDCVVVGAGAAGVTAALFASARGGRVLLLERGARAGAKVARSGNGRGNLLNLKPYPGAYHGTFAPVAERLLQETPPDALAAWFASLGLVLREEGEGRVYPANGHAPGIADVLRTRLAEQGAQLRTRMEVMAIRANPKGGLRVSGRNTETGERFEFQTHSAVVAVGSEAGLPDGEAFTADLLADLGHPVAPIRPALAPLRTDPNAIRGLKGVRVKARVSLMAGCQALREETGEILFGEDCVSGVAAMQCAVAAGEAEGRPLVLHVDLLHGTLPVRPDGDLRLYYEGLAAQTPASPAVRLLLGAAHPRVAPLLLRAAGMPADVSNAGCDWPRVCALLRDWPLPITGVAPLPRAQAASGGALLEGFDPVTLESKRLPRLYAAGEALDIAGDCGGFNLMWAWASGRVAGQAANRKAFN